MLRRLLESSHFSSIIFRKRLPSGSRNKSFSCRKYWKQRHELPSLFQKLRPEGLHNMKKDLFLFMAGGSIYPTLEVIWRGRTHISMAVAGGICLCLIDHICNRRMRRRPLLARRHHHLRGARRRDCSQSDPASRCMGLLRASDEPVRAGVPAVFRSVGSALAPGDGAGPPSGQIPLFVRKSCKRLGRLIAPQGCI